MSHHLEGHVFSRLQQYEALPEGFREEVTALQQHLTKIQSRVFEKHHPNLLKSAVGVKYKTLLRLVKEYLGHHSTRPTASGQDATKIATAKTARAKRFAVALILSGFITPYKENYKFPSPPEQFAFKGSDLLVPVGPTVITPAASDVTVWGVSDRALFAGMVKRKAGFLAAVTEGKDVYVVVNGPQKTLTLFETDVSRESILQVNAVTDGAYVALDKSHFGNGVKVWNQTGTELFNLSSVREREAFVEALAAIGMKCRGDALADLNKTKESESQDVREASPTKPADEQDETHERDSHTTTSVHEGDSGEIQPLKDDELPRPHAIKQASAGDKPSTVIDVAPGPQVSFADESSRIFDCERPHGVPPIGGYYDEPRPRANTEMPRGRYYDGPGPHGDVYRRSSTSDAYGRPPSERCYDERDYYEDYRRRGNTQPPSWEYNRRPQPHYDNRGLGPAPHQPPSGYYSSPDAHPRAPRPPLGYYNEADPHHGYGYHDEDTHYPARPRADTLPPPSKYHERSGRYDDGHYPPPRSYDEPRRGYEHPPAPDRRDYYRRPFDEPHLDDRRGYYESQRGLCAPERYQDSGGRYYDYHERPSRFHRAPDQRDFRSHSPRNGSQWDDAMRKDDSQLRPANRSPNEVAP